MTEVTVNEGPQLTVTIEETAGVETVTVSIPGPPGPQGEPVVGTGDLHYTFTQSLASASWGPINHGLGKFPSVTVVDSAGSVVYGDIIHEDENVISSIDYSAPFSGVAYLN